MDELRQRVAGLTDAQRAELGALALARRGDGDLRIPRRADRERRPPASFAQERLWFVESLRPGHGAYNISLAIPFVGPLSARVIAEALELVVARHEALRTTLALDGSELVQVIHPAAPVVVPVVDLRRMPEAERAGELERLAARELDQGFDLEQGRPLRAVLVRSREDDHTLLVTTHHVSSDGWSVGILRREVRAAYAALARGARPRLAPLPIQYADYAAWQRARHRAGAFAPLVEHWRSALAGAPPALELPRARPRPAAPSLAGAWRGVVLPVGVARDVAAAARAHRTTPFGVLLAAYAAVLHRTSGQEEVVIGIPVANRNRLELEGVIGFFVNALPIRIGFGREDRFADAIARVHGALIAAQQHQELPFEQLVEALDPVRDPARHPVFQASFAFHNLPTLEAPAGGDPEHRADIVRGSIKFDLSLHLREAGGGIAGSLGWATDVLSDEMGAILAERFIATVAAGAARPERRIDELIAAEGGAGGEDAGGDASGAGGGGAGDLPARLRQPGTGLALAGEAPLAWPVLVARARAVADEAQAQEPREPIHAGEDPALGEALVAAAAARLARRGLAAGGAELPPDALARAARAVIAAGPVGAGTAVVPARLAAVHRMLAAALAVEVGGCLVPPPGEADAAAYVDHVTWEGACIAVMPAEMAAEIAAGPAVPLPDVVLAVVGGPLEPSAVEALRARGAAGAVLVDAGAPCAFAAPLAAVAQRPLLGDPVAGAAPVVIDRAGRPVPRGAGGWLAIRRGGALVETGRRATLCADGAIELTVEVRAAAAAVAAGGGPVLDVLAAIWRDVLGHAAGLDDDFFAVGGQSLRATQVVARIRDLLRIPMPVQQLFAARTLRQLAAWIDGDPARARAAAAHAAELCRVAALSDTEVEAELAARVVRGGAAPWT